MGVPSRHYAITDFGLYSLINRLLGELLFPEITRSSKTSHEPLVPQSLGDAPDGRVLIGQESRGALRSETTVASDLVAATRADSNLM